MFSSPNYPQIKQEILAGLRQWLNGAMTQQSTHEEMSVVHAQEKIG